MSDTTPIAALDVGGTAIKSGLVLPDDRVVEVDRIGIDACADRDRLLFGLAGSLRPLVDRECSDRVGLVRIAFPAPFDYPAGRPQLTHKFAALHGVDLAALLRDRLRRHDLRIEFVNDAEAAAVGEALYGAGRGAERVLTVTLGTGFGAALTVAGRPVVSVEEHIVGELYLRRVTGPGDPDGGRRADDQFCAGGLARRLGTRPGRLAEVERNPANAATLAGYGTDLGAFLSDVAADVAADRVVIGGGAVPRSAHFDDAITARLGLTWARAQCGISGPLIGAARMSTTPGHQIGDRDA